MSFLSRWLCMVPPGSAGLYHLGSPSIALTGVVWSVFTAGDEREGVFLPPGFCLCPLFGTYRVNQATSRRP